MVSVSGAVAASTQLSAPEGHRSTCAFIRSVVAALMLIQGRALGLNTSNKLVQQILEWMHCSGFQITVISPFEYCFVVSFILDADRRLAAFNGKYKQGPKPAK